MTIKTSTESGKKIDWKGEKNAYVRKHIHVVYVLHIWIRLLFIHPFSSHAYVHVFNQHDGVSLFLKDKKADKIKLR